MGHSFRKHLPLEGSFWLLVISCHYLIVSLWRSQPPVLKPYACVVSAEWRHTHSADPGLNYSGYNICYFDWPVQSLREFLSIHRSEHTQPVLLPWQVLYTSVPGSDSHESGQGCALCTLDKQWVCKKSKHQINRINQVQISSKILYVQTFLFAHLVRDRWEMCPAAVVKYGCNIFTAALTF